MWRRGFITTLEPALQLYQSLALLIGKSKMAPCENDMVAGTELHAKETGSPRPASGSASTPLSQPADARQAKTGTQTSLANIMSAVCKAPSTQPWASE